MSPKPIHILRHSAGVSSVAFSPDGRTLATASGEDEKKAGLSLWNVETGKLAAELTKGETADQVAFINGNTTLLCLSENGRVKKAQFWDVQRRRVTQSLSNPQKISFQCFAVAPDKSQVGLGGGDFE